MARTTGHYLNPLPGQTIGRTDQGVDFSAAPGTPVHAITLERLAGIIPNWYQGEPFYYFQQLKKVGSKLVSTGVYNYVAEQVRSSAKVGQVFQPGSTIATVASSGTGEELGFATAGGQTLARATTGYTEGEQTAAGKSYLGRVVHGGGTPKAGYSTVNVPNYVPKAYVQWVKTAAQGTGLPATVVAAQINEESGFDPNSTSPTGAEGVAQFEPGTFKSLGIKGSPYTPSVALQAYTKEMSQLLNQYHGNIRNALAAYNAGSGNISAGYGYADTILSKAGVRGSATAGASIPAGITRPGGESANSDGTPQDTGAGVQQILADYETELTLPRTAPASGFASGAGWKAPFTWWWQSFSGQWSNETGK